MHPQDHHWELVLTGDALISLVPFFYSVLDLWALSCLLLVYLEKNLKSDLCTVRHRCQDTGIFPMIYVISMDVHTDKIVQYILMKWHLIAWRDPVFAFPQCVHLHQSYRRRGKKKIWLAYRHWKLKQSSLKKQHKNDFLKSCNSWEFVECQLHY